MKVMIIILRFEDGQQIAAIAPYQEIPESEIENCYFSEASEAPDIMLSDISTMRFDAAETTH